VSSVALSLPFFDLHMSLWSPRFSHRQLQFVLVRSSIWRSLLNLLLLSKSSDLYRWTRYILPPSLFPLLFSSVLSPPCYWITPCYRVTSAVSGIHCPRRYLVSCRSSSLPFYRFIVFTSYLILPSFLLSSTEEVPLPPQ